MFCNWPDEAFSKQENFVNQYNDKWNATYELGLSIVKLYWYVWVVWDLRESEQIHLHDLDPLVW